MINQRLVGTIVALLGALSSPLNAECFRHRCPNCNAACELDVSKEDVKQHGWEIECRTICIPQITWPWQSCCKPKCAKAIRVRTLKKVEWTCPECKFKWTPKECAACGPACGPACAVHSDRSLPSAPPAPQLTEARRLPPRTDRAPGVAPVRIARLAPAPTPAPTRAPAPVVVAPPVEFTPLFR